MANGGTLELLARQLGLALEPLKDRLASGDVIALFAELGLQFPTALLQPAFLNAVNSGSAAAAALADLITALSNSIQSGDEERILELGAKLIQQIGTLTSSFE